MRNIQQRPTDAELEILEVLWASGPSTVREVHSAISVRRETIYTTILKLMQIMLVKQLVDRETKQRSHVYRAKRKAELTQRQLVKDLVSRAFGGSANRLVMQALQVQKISADEIEAIRELLDDLEKAE